MARFDTNILSKYTFTSGSGTTVVDSASTTPVINPLIQGSGYSWISGQGLTFDGATYAIKNGTGSLCVKLDTLKTNDVMTLEAWILPSSTTQGTTTTNATIMAHMNSVNYKCFSMGIADGKYVLKFTGETDRVDAGTLFTFPNANVENDKPQHVIITVDAPNSSAKLYINSILTDTISISPFIDIYTRDIWHFTIGGEAFGEAYFNGNIYFLGIHTTLLTSTQISDNYYAGFIGHTPSDPTPALTVSPETITLGDEQGSNDTVTITSNISWEIVNIPYWLSATPLNGTGNSSVTLTTLEGNLNAGQRSANLTIRQTI